VACNNFAAASNSPIEFKIFERIPTADHKQGINRALNDTLAARRAMLNPLSGIPALPNSSAFASSIEILWRISLPSPLKDAERFSMALNASS